MLLVTAVLLVLTLLLCGGYAGMALLCEIGVLPAMRALSPSAFAETWRAMDSYLDRSMPPYKITLLLVNLAATVCLLLLHHRALAVCAAASFLLSLAALVLTIRKQLPLNRQIKALADQPVSERLVTLRQQTSRNFTQRFVLALLSFAILATGAIFWPLR